MLDRRSIIYVARVTVNRLVGANLSVGSTLPGTGTGTATTDGDEGTDTTGGGDAGTTTVGRSHALSAIAASATETTTEYFMIIFPICQMRTASDVARTRSIVNFSR